MKCIIIYDIGILGGGGGVRNFKNDDFFLLFFIDINYESCIGKF